MVVKTLALSTYLFWQRAVAGPKAVEFIYKFNGVLDCGCAGERAEVPGLVFFHKTGKEYTGKRLGYGDLYVGIGLVILEHGVVAGTVLLDEVVLKNQRLQLRVRNYIFKTGDLLDHHVYLRSAPYVGTKIRPYTVVQVDGFAHIHNGVVGIAHYVDPGILGEFFQFFLDIEV